jgi:drug/metabolite transporter (DMT)-like permease
MTVRLDDPVIVDGVRDTGGRVSLAIFACKKPVIAAINGAAVGIGATMTLAMDVRLASEKARIGFVFGRIGIQLSDPLSFSVVVAVVNPLVLWILFTLMDREFHTRLVTPELRREIRPLLLLGLLFALMRIADQIALSLTLASYAMAVKRTAGVFSVLLGHWFFAERYMAIKLVGSAVMLLGVLALTQD